MDLNQILVAQMEQLNNGLKRQNNIMFFAFCIAAIAVLAMLTQVEVESHYAELMTFFTIAAAAGMVCLFGYLERRARLKEANELRNLFFAQGIKQGWSNEEVKLFWFLVAHDGEKRRQKVQLKLADLGIQGPNTVAILAAGQVEVLQAYYS